MTIASTKIEKENSNWSALTVFRKEPRKAPAMPPKARRSRRPQLRLDRAARPCGRRHLVLAHRDPGAAEARVAQPEVDEQHHQHQGERDPVPRPQVERRELLARPGQVDLVDRRDALAAGGERVAEDREPSPLTATRPMISPNASVTIAM